MIRQALDRLRSESRSSGLGIEAQVFEAGVVHYEAWQNPFTENGKLARESLTFEDWIDQLPAIASGDQPLIEAGIHGKKMFYKSVETDRGDQKTVSAEMSKLADWAANLEYTAAIKPPADFDAAPIIRRNDGAEFNEIESSAARKLLDHVRMNHIRGQNRVPFTFFDLGNQVYYDEIVTQIGGKSSHVARVFVLSKSSQVDYEITEFFFVNGAYVGYGVARYLSRSDVELQFNLFEDVPGTHFGRGKIPGLARRVFEQRLESLSSHLDGNAVLTVEANQFNSPIALQFYRNMGFVPWDTNVTLPENIAGMSEDEFQVLFKSLRDGLKYVLNPRSADGTIIDVSVARSEARPKSDDFGTSERFRTGLSEARGAGGAVAADMPETLSLRDQLSEMIQSSVPSDRIRLDLEQLGDLHIALEDWHRIKRIAYEMAVDVRHYTEKFPGIEDASFVGGVNDGHLTLQVRDHSIGIDEGEIKEQARHFIHDDPGLFKQLYGDSIDPGLQRRIMDPALFLIDGDLNKILGFLHLESDKDGSGFGFVEIAGTAELLGGRMDIETVPSAEFNEAGERIPSENSGTTVTVTIPLKGLSRWSARSEARIAEGASTAEISPEVLQDSRIADNPQALDRLVSSPVRLLNVHGVDVHTTLPLAVGDLQGIDEPVRITQNEDGSVSIVAVDSLEALKAERYKWNILDSGMDEVNDSFRAVLNGENLSNVILQRIQGLADGEILTILDWGAGDGSALIGLAKKIEAELGKEALEKVRMIGSSNAYFPNWSQAREYGISFILDDAQNFEAILQEMRISAIDIIYSHWGLNHLGMPPHAQEYIDHLKVLNGRLSQNGFIVHNNFGGKILSLFRQKFEGLVAEIMEKQNEVDGNVVLVKRSEVRSIAVEPGIEDHVASQFTEQEQRILDRIQSYIDLAVSNVGTARGNLNGLIALNLAMKFLSSPDLPTTFQEAVIDKRHEAEEQLGLPRILRYSAGQITAIDNKGGARDFTLSHEYDLGNSKVLLTARYGEPGDRDYGKIEFSYDLNSEIMKVEYAGLEGNLRGKFLYPAILREVLGDFDLVDAIVQNHETRKGIEDGMPVEETRLGRASSVGHEGAEVYAMRIGSAIHLVSIRGARGYELFDQWMETSPEDFQVLDSALPSRSEVRKVRRKTPLLADIGQDWDRSQASMVISDAAEQSLANGRIDDEQRKPAIDQPPILILRQSGSNGNPGVVVKGNHDGYYNPQYPDSEDGTNVVDKYAKELRKVLSGRNGQKLLASIMNNADKINRFQGLFDHAAIQYFNFRMQQARYEGQTRNGEGERVRVRDVIKEYIRDMMRLTGGFTRDIDVTALSDDERDIARKYAFLALELDEIDRPFSKLVMLHREMPELVVMEGKPGSDHPNAFVIEHNLYIGEEGRRALDAQGNYVYEEFVRADGKTVDQKVLRLPPERIIFARWQGRRFMMYSSRSHTYQGAVVRSWRQAEGFSGGVQGGWIVKQAPENLDDLPVELAVRLDQTIDRAERDPRQKATVRGMEAFLELAKDLGFLNFRYPDVIEDVYAAQTRGQLRRVLRKVDGMNFKDNVLGNRQFQEAVQQKRQALGMAPQRFLAQRQAPVAPPAVPMPRDPVKELRKKLSELVRSTSGDVDWGERIQEERPLQVGSIFRITSHEFRVESLEGNEAQLLHYDQRNGILIRASGKVTIGRHPDNDIVISGEGVSRRHAVLDLAGVVPTLTDLGTRNGTYLLPARRSEARPDDLQRHPERSEGSRAEILQPFGLQDDGTTVRADARNIGRRDSLKLLGAFLTTAVGGGVLSMLRGSEGQKMRDLSNPLSEQEFKRIKEQNRVPAIDNFSYKDYRASMNENGQYLRDVMAAMTDTGDQAIPQSLQPVADVFHRVKNNLDGIEDAFAGVNAVVIVPGSKFTYDVPGTIDSVTGVAFVNQDYLNRSGPATQKGKLIRLIDGVSHEGQHRLQGFQLYDANGQYSLDLHAKEEVSVYGRTTLRLHNEFGTEAFEPVRMKEVRDNVMKVDREFRGGIKGETQAKLWITGQLKDMNSTGRSESRPSGLGPIPHLPEGIDKRSETRVVAEVKVDEVARAAVIDQLGREIRRHVEGGHLSASDFRVIYKFDEGIVQLITSRENSSMMFDFPMGQPFYVGDDREDAVADDAEVSEIKVVQEIDLRDEFGPGVVIAPPGEVRGIEKEVHRRVNEALKYLSKPEVEVKADLDAIEKTLVAAQTMFDGQLFGEIGLGELMDAIRRLQMIHDWTQNNPQMWQSHETMDRREVSALAQEKQDQWQLRSKIVRAKRLLSRLQQNRSDARGPSDDEILRRQSSQGQDNIVSARFIAKQKLPLSSRALLAIVDEKESRKVPVDEDPILLIGSIFGTDEIIFQVLSISDAEVVLMAARRGSVRGNLISLPVAKLETGSGVAVVRDAKGLRLTGRPNVEGALFRIRKPDLLLRVQAEIDTYRYPFSERMILPAQVIEHQISQSREDLPGEVRLRKGSVIEASRDIYYQVLSVSNDGIVLYEFDRSNASDGGAFHYIPTLRFRNGGQVAIGIEPTADIKLPVRAATLPFKGALFVDNNVPYLRDLGSAKDVVMVYEVPTEEGKPQTLEVLPEGKVLKTLSPDETARAADGFRQAAESASNARDDETSTFLRNAARRLRALLNAKIEIGNLFPLSSTISKRMKKLDSNLTEAGWDGCKRPIRPMRIGITRWAHWIG